MRIDQISFYRRSQLSTFLWALLFIITDGASHEWRDVDFIQIGGFSFSKTRGTKLLNSFTTIDFVARCVFYYYFD